MTAVKMTFVPAKKAPQAALTLSGCTNSYKIRYSLRNISAQPPKTSPLSTWAHYVTSQKRTAWQRSQRRPASRVRASTVR